MKIKRMVYFVKGIIDILLALLIICVIIKTHKDLLLRIFAMIMLLFFGISEIVYSIETKAQRMKREEELKQMAELYGWIKKEEE